MSGTPCSMDHGPGNEGASNVWVRHLVGSCSDSDREALAIPAEDILEVLRSGRGIDLEGVVITGDLMLDRLSPEPVSVDRLSSPRAQQALVQEGLEAVRVVHGPFIIKQSRMQGVLATNIHKRGYLIIKGPVELTGTRFDRSFDLSRVIFLDRVDFSDSVVANEGFFIHSLFDGPATFERMAFGLHSRFHRAEFSQSVVFTRAGFNGMAEFLQVTFHQDAGFSRTRFVEGTGFSGSQFLGTSDFSEAVFDREVYFRFANFQGDAFFRRAKFHDVADFTEAQFQGVSDFTKVVFEVPPQITGIEVPYSPPMWRGLRNPRVQIGLLVIGGLGLLILVFWKK